MKKIISTILATTMLTSVANAELVSNGGKPSISLTEIQANLDSGKYTNYPGVVRIVNDIRVVGSKDGFLFSDTFKPGMALPEIHDYVALKKVLDNKKTILVASNDWIIPTPEIFVELGKQNGVDGITFMAHYLEATAGIDSDAFGEYAEAQTKAVLDVLNVPTVTIDTKPLVDQGLLDEIQAKTIENAALQVAINTANERIDELTAENTSLVAQIASLTATIDSHVTTINDLTSRLEAKTSQAHTFLNALGTVRTQLAESRAEAARLQNELWNEWDISTGLQADLDAISSEVSNITTRLQGYVTRINNAVNANPVGSVTVDTTTTQSNVVNVDSYTVANAKVTNSSNGSSIASVNTIHNEDENQANITINGDSLATIDFNGLNTEIAQSINEAIADAYGEGYEDGYADGYADGYTDGWNDAVESVR